MGVAGRRVGGASAGVGAGKPGSGLSRLGYNAGQATKKEVFALLYLTLQQHHLCYVNGAKIVKVTTT